MSSLTSGMLIIFLATCYYYRLNLLIKPIFLSGFCSLGMICLRCTSSIGRKRLILQQIFGDLFLDNQKKVELRTNDEMQKDHLPLPCHVVPPIKAVCCWGSYSCVSRLLIEVLQCWCERVIIKYVIMLILHGLLIFAKCVSCDSSKKVLQGIV